MMKAPKKTENVHKLIAKRLMDTDVELIITSDYIANQYGNGLLNTDAMASIMNVKPDSVLTYINQHKMPFEVTKIGNQWFTTPYAVARYVIDNRIDRGEFVPKAVG